MFPGLMFKPGQGGALPLLGRRRFAVGGFGKRFQPAKIYGRLGNLEVRLARKKSEIRRAQRLRYKVFYEEMSATPGALAILSRRDEDEFDPIFDHLLVIDRGDANDGRRWRRSKVVGTYRCCARMWPISMTASTRKANTTSRRCSGPSPIASS